MDPLLDGYSAAVVTTVGEDYSKKALSVDQVARVLCPIAFIIFACFYWLYYLLVINVDDLMFWQHLNLDI
jgi:hypothetical protein